ncbi:hypothetical protein EVG20_g4875 [Dentipellis fragilis]|uniref:Uncharacterized protein n=1 Tax=Dentipellis fragilis TaxID=205917 RepID=A0A4Y9YUW5_9AGAM|nr:hypothetical protein EVG20_g4875 [Dentipellis fragilis]
MAIKRKFDADAVEASTRSAKQLRLAVPFPAYQYESDNDVMMSDASSEPELIPTEHYHYRLDSGASTASSASSADPSSYPSFNIYPKSFFGPNGVDTDSHTFARLATPPPQPKNVGLFEPKGNFHHGCKSYADRSQFSPAALVFVVVDPARKSPSFVSPVLQAPMVNARCGATANSVALSRWSTPTTDALSSTRFLRLNNPSDLRHSPFAHRHLVLMLY